MDCRLCKSNECESTLMEKFKSYANLSLVWVGDKLEGPHDKLASQDLSPGKSGSLLAQIKRKNSSLTPRTKYSSMLSMDRRKDKYQRKRRGSMGDNRTISKESSPKQNGYS